MANPYRVSYIDENGDKAVSAHWVREAVVDPSTLGLLQAAIRSVTSCQLLENEIIIDKGFAGADATINPYDAADKAVFFFLDADGFTQKVVVPSPDTAIFLIDDETVDPANMAVQEFITEVLIFLITRGAAALVSFIKGKRQRRNRKSN